MTVVWCPSSPGGRGGEPSFGDSPPPPLGLGGNHRPGGGGWTWGGGGYKRAVQKAGDGLIVGDEAARPRKTFSPHNINLKDDERAVGDPVGEVSLLGVPWTPPPPAGGGK